MTSSRATNFVRQRTPEQIQARTPRPISEIQNQEVNPQVQTYMVGASFILKFAEIEEIFFKFGEIDLI